MALFYDLCDNFMGFKELKAIIKKNDNFKSSGASTPTHKEQTYRAT